MKKKTIGKSNLLESLIGDDITLVTGMCQPMQGEDGLVVEVPVTYSGLLLDFDESYLALELSDFSVAFVSREFLVAIEMASETSKILSDPNKPNADDMN